MHRRKRRRRRASPPTPPCRSPNALPHPHNFTGLCAHPSSPNRFIRHTGRVRCSTTHATVHSGHTLVHSCIGTRMDARSCTTRERSMNRSTGHRPRAPSTRMTAARARTMDTLSYGDPDPVQWHAHHAPCVITSTRSTSRRLVCRSKGTCRPPRTPLTPPRTRPGWCNSTITSHTNGVSSRASTTGSRHTPRGGRIHAPYAMDCACQTVGKHDLLLSYIDQVDSTPNTCLPWSKCCLPPGTR